MPKTNKNQPKAQLRDGLIEVAIWENPTNEGDRVRYSAEFTRRYRDAEGNWHSSSSFGNGELLRLSRLAEKAYDKIGEIRAEAKTE